MGVVLNAWRALESSKNGSQSRKSKGKQLRWKGDETALSCLVRDEFGIVEETRVGTDFVLAAISIYFWSSLIFESTSICAFRILLC